MDKGAALSAPAAVMHSNVRNASLFAEKDEIAGHEILKLYRYKTWVVPLNVGIPSQDDSGKPVAKLYDPGAVQSERGRASPEIGCAQKLQAPSERGLGNRVYGNLLGTLNERGSGRIK
jgi:hypothetical protein